MRPRRALRRRPLRPAPAKPRSTPRPKPSNSGEPKQKMRTGADGGGCFPTGRHYPGIAHLLRAAAVGVARELGVECVLSELPLVAIDTETTGRDPALDRI